MTKTEFLTTQVEANPKFIKWAKEPVQIEKHGDVEKWQGLAYITTTNGTNTWNIFFMVDASTGETTWQEFNTLEPEKTVENTKYASLQNYLKGKYEAFFIKGDRVDLTNNWAEAEVYSLSADKLTRKTVLVFKKGNNPVSDLDII